MEWNGFLCEEITFEGQAAYIVFPKKETVKKLAVKTEYWGAFSEAIEIPLLEAGYYLCYIQNNNRWGTEEDIARKARFVRYIQEKYDLERKCIPIGMSCGGLFAIKFAAVYPELVSCLYLDAPVVNYMSCPYGFGEGNRLGPDFSEIMNALSLKTIGELLAYREMPLDKIDILVQKEIPIIMIAGDSDMSVPYLENGIFIQKAYEAAGIAFELHTKVGCGHHPHGLEDPNPVLQFFEKYA